jgi:hypothetical protein
VCRGVVESVVDDSKMEAYLLCGGSGSAVWCERLLTRC